MDAAACIARQDDYKKEKKLLLMTVFGMYATKMTINIPSTTKGLRNTRDRVYYRMKVAALECLLTKGAGNCRLRTI